MRAARLVQLIDVTLRDATPIMVPTGDASEAAAMFDELHIERDDGSDSDEHAQFFSEKSDAGDHRRTPTKCYGLLWGVSDAGETVCVRVAGVRPFAFLPIYPAWAKPASLRALTQILSTRSRAQVQVSIVRHRKLWGWSAPSQVPAPDAGVSPPELLLWAKIWFPSMWAVRTLTRSLERDGAITIQGPGGPADALTMRRLRLEEDGGRHSACFEHKIFDMADMVPGSWISVDTLEVARERATLAKLEYSAPTLSALSRADGPQLLTN